MIQIIDKKISSEQIRQHLGQPFDEMVKFVVDIQKQIMALGGRMHADGEKILLENGSKQEDLWGGNWYPNHPEDSRVEYTSLINIRPRMGNRAMEIQDLSLRQKVKAIAERLLA